ncbi:unnamed protein product [Macrosiphum euphorbiae]|nr:unnamed protein product [Macrosiphum euphorbiae]
MIKVIQINLNHCWTAQQLISQTVRDRNIDVLLISDYHRGFEGDPRWIDSADLKCGVLVTSRRLHCPSQTEEPVLASPGLGLAAPITSAATGRRTACC